MLRQRTPKNRRTPSSFGDEWQTRSFLVSRDVLAERVLRFEIARWVPGATPQQRLWN